MVDATVEYDYEAVNDDELSIKVGDTITNCIIIEDGWMEGQLDGKTGAFPDNFVIIIENEKQNPLEECDTRSDSSDLRGRRALVTFSYAPSNDDELELFENEIITIEEETEDGWYSGVSRDKTGVFPSNFVQLLPLEGKDMQTSDEKHDALNNPDNTVPSPDSDVPMTPPDSMESNDSQDTEPITDKASTKSPSETFGLGNIFSDGPIKLKHVEDTSSGAKPQEGVVASPDVDLGSKSKPELDTGTPSCEGLSGDVEDSLSESEKCDITPEVSNKDDHRSPETRPHPELSPVKPLRPTSEVDPNIVRTEPPPPPPATEDLPIISDYSKTGTDSTDSIFDTLPTSPSKLTHLTSSRPKDKRRRPPSQRPKSDENIFEFALANNLLTPEVEEPEEKKLAPSSPRPVSMFGLPQRPPLMKKDEIPKLRHSVHKPDVTVNESKPEECIPPWMKEMKQKQGLKLGGNKPPVTEISTTKQQKEKLNITQEPERKILNTEKPTPKDEEVTPEKLDTFGSKITNKFTSLFSSKENSTSTSTKPVPPSSKPKLPPTKPQLPSTSKPSLPQSKPTHIQKTDQITGSQIAAVKTDRPSLKSDPQIKTDPPQIKTDPPQMKTDPPQIKTDPPQMKTDPPNITIHKHETGPDTGTNKPTTDPLVLPVRPTRLKASIRPQPSAPHIPPLQHPAPQPVTPRPVKLDSSQAPQPTVTPQTHAQIPTTGASHNIEVESAVVLSVEEEIIKLKQSHELMRCWFEKELSDLRSALEQEKQQRIRLQEQINSIRIQQNDFTNY